MADISIKIQIEAAKAQAQLAKLTAQTAKFNAQAEKARVQTSKAKQQIDNLGNAARRSGKGFSVANISLASFIGNITSRVVSSAITGLVNGFKDIINRGREFEAGLVSVGKTTGIQGKALQRLGKDIENIGKRIPVPTQRLLELATVAGQLGINSAPQIEKFTETMAKLELATDIAGEEGSQAVAKILDLTDELGEDGAENIDKFGAVVTQLGNNFATTEAQIVKVANEVAKGVAAFDVSSEDVLGLATAFKVTGSEAEISGSVIQKVFVSIGKAVEKGGEDLTKFAEAADLSEESFAEIFRNDPTQAFLKLSEGLNKSGKSGAQLAITLEELGFADRRVSKSLIPLITRYDTLSRSISEARTEAEKRTALDEETSRAQDTLNADLQKLNNSFDRLSNSIFKSASPALRSLTQNTTSFIDTLNSANVQATVFDSTLGLWLKTLTPLASVLSEVDKVFEDNIKNVEELDEGYANLDGSTQKYLSSLTDLIDGKEQLKGPLEQTRIKYDELGNAVEDTTIKIVELDKAVTNQRGLAFEQEKLKQLKKFYKEDEIAKIESTFAKIKSIDEEKKFLNTFISEGEARQKQSFLRTIGLDKATVDAARKKAEELKQIQQEQLARDEELANRQQELLLAQEQARLLELGNNQIFYDEKLIQLQNFFTAEEEAAVQAKLNLTQNEVEKQAIITQAQIDAIRNRKNLNDEALKDFRTAESDYTKFKQQQEKTREQNLRSSLGTISTLQNSSNKTLGAIGKAAAIANITISTAQGVAQAFSLGPILGPILAPIVAAAGAAQAAQVSGVRFEKGGIVGGTSFTGDKVQARVNSGEMILNRQQQTQLFSMANGRNSSQESNQPINITTRVMIDDEVVGEANSRWVANGGQVGEVQ